MEAPLVERTCTNTRKFVKRETKSVTVTITKIGTLFLTFTIFT